ncbi:DNA topoisomerase II [Vibrio phage VAP7]|uniref:DNA topoisomerase 2 n=2 Tax=Vapseptimavirus VAP7 TaxID=2841303 RepID=A0A4Y5TW82_9CAUD|nr:DNA topoisomerase II [Vibrio phage VAP7]AWY10121.1 DNA topoisomerase II large subunit [Vibrio phage VP-1]QDB73295.1 DNA topoisomerase [Vibrio phage VAP7]
MSKTSAGRDINSLYKELSHHEHILLRPDRHVGSTKTVTKNTWIYDAKNNTVAEDKLSWCPALAKMFDEIITNSVDFSKTPEGSHLDTIEVTLNRMNGSISITDNGGIPVAMHESGKWVPDMLFGSLFAGSNFNDGDDEYDNKYSAGQNGEGASLVNLFSKSFTVKTSDGKKAYTGVWKNNMSEHKEPNIRNTTNKRGFTCVQWVPDYQRLGLKKLDIDNYLMFVRRTFEIAACNPHLTVKLNSVEIQINSFRDFVRKFDTVVPAFSQGKDWQIGLLASKNGFQHESYVNSICTHSGGPHLDYVADKIVAKIRPKLQKALKVKNLAPATIKNAMHLFVNATIDNPRFNSQTKETMTTQVKDFGTKMDELDDAFIKKAYQLTLEVLDAEIAKKKAEEEAAEIDANQNEASKMDPRKIEKYVNATGRDRSKCILFLAEGDSAAKPIKNARIGAIHGLMPMRGKFPNAMRVSRQKLTSNTEFQAIQAILGGFKIGKPMDMEKLRYAETWMATDADYDGSHIRGLIISLFYTCWPEYIKQGRLKSFNTPIYRVWKGKQMFEFFSVEEYKAWAKENPNHKKKYLKGLGGNSTADIRRMMLDPDKYTVTISMDEAADHYLKIAFDKDMADVRKEFFEDVTLYGGTDD